MSSISCWTSATKCSNSSVSHPTSNSYPTFSWSIHRWRYSSPIVCPAPSPSIRDSANRCVVGFLELRGLGMWVRDFNRAKRRQLRGRRHRAHKGRAKSRQRKLLPDCVLFIFLNLFTLIHSLACSAFGSLSYLYITHQTCAATFKKFSAQHPITSK